MAYYVHSKSEAGGLSLSIKLDGPPILIGADVGFILQLWCGEVNALSNFVGI